MESNGSTSMASVCGGSLALMDAGVPMIRPVAGISIGLCTDHDEKDEITRLQALDRHHRLGRCVLRHGLQDRRHREGITGFQLDLKLRGIPHTS
jgi:polyribonucleotide nucleotidyltransferase